MLNSKHLLYTMSSGILMVMVLLSPLYNIKAQEEYKKNDPLIILSNIRNLLDNAITELNNGNYTGASDLVDIAYSDNYEYLEDPLKKLDKDLMEETEVMIREDFASAIEDKKPVDEITTLHTNIESNLDMAEKLFKQ
jgi:high-affinity iron transporter